jgi:hypothetical protein
MSVVPVEPELELAELVPLAEPVLGVVELELELQAAIRVRTAAIAAAKGIERLRVVMEPPGPVLG